MFSDNICIIIHIIIIRKELSYISLLLCAALEESVVIDGSLGLKTCTCGQQKMYWSKHATIKGSINSGGMWGRSSTSFCLGAATRAPKRSQKKKKKKHDWWEGIMKEGNKREQRRGILPVYFEYSTKNALLSLECLHAHLPPHPPPLVLPLLVWSSLL